MKLHPTQSIVAQDNHDYRVVCCGRQWGKTTLSILEMVACAYAGKGKEIAYFATTFDQARNIAWAMLKDFARPIFSRPPNESRLELWVHTQDKGESKIALRGFENVETARGQQFDLLVIDEVAQMRNWNYAWQAILEPTLAFRKGKALFISTPLGKNHFFELYEKGQQEGNYKSWRFKSEENPYLPKERVEQARKESTEDYFAQEYLADFRKYTGLVYKEFQREIHVIAPIDLSGGQTYRGFDFGSTNPTVCLWVIIDGDENWFIVNEHYEIGQTIDYHAGRINASPFNKNIIASYGDPSGAQWIQEFAQRQIFITPANKEMGTNFNSWVRFGIEKVADRLKTIPGRITPVNRKLELGEPRLYIFSTCVNTIKEFETYRWKEKNVSQAQDLNEPDVPEKASDHAMDALRYIIVSVMKHQVSKPYVKKKWSI